MHHKVIISGGGTGGHVFPAIAIAHALKKQDQEMEILFIGAKGKMEMEKVPAAGYPIKGLWISGFQRNMSIRNLMFPFKVVSSLIRANNMINDFKPDAVVGVGGYSSGPVVYMASKKKIPTLIQEQNSYAGVTNKILAPRVDKACVAYDHMERYFPAHKIIHTGNPVRDTIANMQVSDAESLEYFGLRDKGPTILAIGGSLGARTINQSIVRYLDKILDAGVSLIWQTGKPFFEEAKQVAGDHDRIKVFDFIDRMDHAYTAADVILSRAGAIAVSELAIVGKAVILVPYPYAAEDHQAKNAQALVDKGAALMFRDDESTEKLIPAALELLSDSGRRQQLGAAIRQLAITDAADRIAAEVLDLVLRRSA